MRAELKTRTDTVKTPVGNVQVRRYSARGSLRGVFLEGRELGEIQGQGRFVLVKPHKRYGQQWRAASYAEGIRQLVNIDALDHGKPVVFQD